MANETNKPTPAAPQGIQPTDIPESLLPSSGMELFLEQNFPKILIAVGVIIVGSGIYAVVSHFRHEAAVASSEAATKAKTKEDCDLVIRDFPGSTAAGNAQLLKAKLLWDENKKDDSIATLRAFLSDYTDHPFRRNAQLSLATQLEATKKVGDATKLYQEIVAEHESQASGGNSAIVDIASLAKLRLADILLGEGKTDEAKKIFEQFGKDFSGSAFIEQSREHLTWITSGLPTKEVDGPVKPKEDPAKGAPQINTGSGPLGGIGLTPGGAGATTQPFTISPAPAGTSSATGTAMPPINIETKPTVNPPNGAPTAPKLEIKPNPPISPKPITPGATTPAPALNGVPAAPTIKVTPTAPAATPPAKPAAPAASAPPAAPATPAVTIPVPGTPVTPAKP